MSTEATSDGTPDAAGAVEPGAVTEGAEPPVPEAAPAGLVPDQAAAPEEGAAPEDGAAGDEAEGDDELAEAGELDELEELDQLEAVEGLDELDRLDQLEEVDGDYEDVDEDYEDYAYDEVLEGGEALEYDKAYEDYESGEIAAPRRARRWPRVLLAFGFVMLAVVIVGGAVAIVGSVTHGFKKPVKITYKKSAVFSLQTGECIDPQGQSYSLIACDSPHVAEVFATFTLTGSKWPGDTAVQAQASNGCSSRLTGYVNPQLAISLASTYVYPDPVAWQAGTRTVICEVRASSGNLTGSVRGASATAS
jgi:Septum formation